MSNNNNNTFLNCNFKKVTKQDNNFDNFKKVNKGDKEHNNFNFDNFKKVNKEDNFEKVNKQNEDNKYLPPGSNNIENNNILINRFLLSKEFPKKINNFITNNKNDNNNFDNFEKVNKQNEQEDKDNIHFNNTNKYDKIADKYENF